MNLMNVTNVASHIVTTDKEIGSLDFYFNEYFDNLTNEKINLRVERNGQNTIAITKTPVLLKHFIGLATYGRQAISSFPATHYEPWKTACKVLLTLDGNIELSGNDKIIIEFTDLNPAINYVLDGCQHDDTNPDDSEIVLYEEKILADYLKDTDINVDDYYQGVIEDSVNVKEFNVKYKSGNVIKMTPRELRMLAVDADPLAYVRQDGQVKSCYKGFLQFHVEDIISINVVKDANTQVTALFSKHMRMVQLGLTK